MLNDIVIFSSHVENQITIMTVLEPVGIAQNEICDVILVSACKVSATSWGIASPPPTEDRLHHPILTNYYSEKYGLPACTHLYPMYINDHTMGACFFPSIFPASAICTFRNSTYTISRFPHNVTCQVTRIPYGSLCPAFWFEPSKQRERQKDQPPPNTSRC